MLLLRLEKILKNSNIKGTMTASKLSEKIFKDGMHPLSVISGGNCIIYYHSSIVPIFWQMLSRVNYFLRAKMSSLGWVNYFW